MKRSFTASISQEVDWYIAQCMQVDVASQGATEDEALDNVSIRSVEAYSGLQSWPR